MRASRVQLRVEVVDDRIPGPAPVSEHSRFTAVADAAPVVATVAPASRGGAGAGPPSLTIGGHWLRLATDTDDPIPADIDDVGWDRVQMPNNFGREASLSQHFGPVWYRKRLTPLFAPYTRLEFEAVDYLADVWLDGQHLGHHEGYFAPFGFDVTGRVQPGSVLTVKVQDPFEDLEDDAPLFAHAKRVIKGVLKYHDSRPGGLPGARMTPGWNARLGQSLTTGGITAPVRLRGSGAVRIESLFVTPVDDAADVAHVALVVTNLAPSPVEATFELDMTRGRAAVQATLPPGPGRIDLQVTVPGADRWWPMSHRELGGPALHRVEVTALVDGAASDRQSTRFGFRTARIEGEPQRLVVNGRSVFVQGANYIPLQHFAGADAEFYRRDMTLAQAAHLNSLGVHGHLQPPACYDAADEQGVLIFQDFPLQWRYDSGTDTNPGFVDTAQRQVAEMAYTYWNHPSIVYWACHNEPMALFFPGSDPDPATDMDNQVLDQALEQRLRTVEVDGHPGARHVHRASGLGGDLHVYDGSLSGRDVYKVREAQAWFVSEYGFWTVGPGHTNWPDGPWPPVEAEMRDWMSRLSFAPSTMAYAGLPERYPNRAAWARATELYGSFLAKYQTEWMRLHRGAPFMAYRWHFFADWWGWAGGGLVDVDREPKAVYGAMQAASRPVLVATSLDGTVFAPGSPLRFEIGAVNERLADVDLAVTWRWRRQTESVVIGVDTEVGQRYQLLTPPTEGAMVAVPSGEPGDVLDQGTGLSRRLGPESAALNIGTITVTAPPEQFAGATLELTWQVDGRTEQNWYHVLTAPDGWFCGPGAFAVTPAGVRRLS